MSLRSLAPLTEYSARPTSLISPRLKKLRALQRLHIGPTHCMLHSRAIRYTKRWKKNINKNLWCFGLARMFTSDIPFSSTTALAVFSCKHNSRVGGESSLLCVVIKIIFNSRSICSVYPVDIEFIYCRLKPLNPYI